MPAATGCNCTVLASAIADSLHGIPAAASSCCSKHSALPCLLQQSVADLGRLAVDLLSDNACNDHEFARVGHHPPHPPEASTLPPMASTSRTRRRWVRDLVVLKAMYSSRWDTPGVRGGRVGGRGRGRGGSHLQANEQLGGARAAL